ncbi:MAG: DNA-3-methyladenine glycosylase [Janthinobacterium lividum]
MTGCDIDFTRPAYAVARDLIGATFLVDGIGGVIIETEAYEHDDPASHSFSGPTLRNMAMFGEPGNIYVYRSYGLHWCLNIVCGPAGHGAAVLLRALWPSSGIDIMQQRRGMEDLRLLCAGPGRLSQALGIHAGHNGLAVTLPPFSLSKASSRSAVLEGPRIGISKAVEMPWRFGLAGASGLSKRFKP